MAAVYSTEAVKRTPVPYSPSALLPPHPNLREPARSPTPVLHSASNTLISHCLQEQPWASHEGKDLLTRLWRSGTEHVAWWSTSRAFTVDWIFCIQSVSSASDFLLQQPPRTEFLSARSLFALFSGSPQWGPLAPWKTWRFSSEFYSSRGLLYLHSVSAVQELGTRGLINMQNALTSQVSEHDFIPLFFCV